MKLRIVTDRRTIRVAAMILISLLCCPTLVQGGILPHSSVQKMCFTADLILTGTHIGNGKLHVEHVFYERVPTTKTI
ncbi:MAG: hypothetical protein ACYSUX_07965, partial [Planctomycetota bacterium]